MVAGDMSAPGGEPGIQEGWIDQELAVEFPRLRLVSAVVEGRRGPSAPGVARRLRGLSDRFYGARAIAMRSEPVPHAYRVFFRSVGMDPDTTRPPLEAAALERLMFGGFRARNLVDDALLVALVETGVPVWALDDELIDGPLGIRPTRGRESLGRGEMAAELPPGRLVVADASGPVAELFGRIAPGHEPTAGAHRLRLFSIQVAGVPGIHVEEALWLAVVSLAGG
jgi:DNA/RNA-binding domain of Phe-tRNA-synthetase-like protein